VARDLLCVITLVVNLWLGGRCPLSLAEFVASAPLTPLLKSHGEIRPIAVGTIWRRLVSKVAMKGVGKDMAKYLNDFQFGVGGFRWGGGYFAQYQQGDEPATWRWFLNYAYSRFFECFQLGRQVGTTT